MAVWQSTHLYSPYKTLKSRVAGLPLFMTAIYDISSAVQHMSCRNAWEDCWERLLFPHITLYAHKVNLQKTFHPEIKWFSFSAVLFIILYSSTYNNITNCFYNFSYRHSSIYFYCSLKYKSAEFYIQTLCGQLGIYTINLKGQFTQKCPFGQLLTPRNMQEFLSFVEHKRRYFIAKQ